MFSRKGLLKIMLGSLAAAALAGVLSALTAEFDIVERVMWSGLTAAVTAAALFPLAMLVDREKWRATGLLGMAAVLAIFFLVLALIWWEEISRFVGGRYDEEELALTILWLVLVTPFAMGFLQLSRINHSRWAGWTGLGAAVVTFATLLIGMWGFGGSAGNWSTAGYWHESAGAVALGGALAALALVGQGTHRRPWRWIGVAASVWSTGMILWYVWRFGQDERYTVIPVSLAAFIVHANVLVTCPLRPNQRWLLVLTVAATAFAMVLLDVLVIMEVGDRSLVGRILAATAIVVVCGSLAVIILSRINRGVDLESGERTLFNVTLLCPRCRRKQTLPVGDGVCAHCDLRISIRIEEPRCTNCGYLLYRLTSNACPECGAPITRTPQPAPVP